MYTYIYIYTHHTHTQNLLVSYIHTEVGELLGESRRQTRRIQDLQCACVSVSMRTCMGMCVHTDMHMYVCGVCDMYV
ncbi:hypothetical protein EON63_19715 [archaeon]|nr:MAG: hypothetical protein EON63_19715 [archaeon]